MKPTKTRSKTRRPTLRHGWKVLRAGNHSALITTYGTRNYTVGKWTTPKKGCGPLCVFTSSANASFFVAQQTFWLDTSISLTIVPCKYVHSRSQSIWKLVRGLDGKPKKADRPLSDLPPGTALARKVRLVKEAS